MSRHEELRRRREELINADEDCRESAGGGLARIAELERIDAELAAPFTIEQAREKVAKFAELGGEEGFAREVRAGQWDHRSDVQAALRGEL